MNTVRIYIPKCVDRTVYCSELPEPADAKRITLVRQNENHLRELGTKVQFKCETENWFFDHEVPDDLVSFYYSTNIANTA